MDYNKNPKSNTPTPQEEALDTLLKTKSDRDRLESWKELMPMPEEEGAGKTKRKSIAILASIAGLALVFFILNQTIIKPNQPVYLAENLIETTVITSLDDMNSRGEEATIKDENAEELLKAIELLKSDNDQAFVAIEILSDLAETKHRYQMEAIWFNALAHIKVGNKSKAKSELERLASLSNYQQQNVQSLLNKI